jgi:hypothetical protein
VRLGEQQAQTNKLFMMRYKKSVVGEPLRLPRSLSLRDVLPFGQTVVIIVVVSLVRYPKSRSCTPCTRPW